jgi:tripartite ATP-independent transporter DctM subunit
MICAGGALGSMIPPSIILVFFGLAANVSIGDLLLASVMPGLLMAGLYCLYILVRCNLDPAMGPVAPFADRDMPLLAKIKLMRGLVLPTVIVLCVMGSIYAGLASVTESAALGVLGVLFAVWIRGELNWTMLHRSLMQTMVTCGAVFWLVFGANALIGVYNLMGGIAMVQSLVKDLALSPLMTIAAIMLIWVILGTILEWIAIMLLTLPIFLPIIKSLGYDPVWFGILFSINMQITYLSPPIRRGLLLPQERGAARDHHGRDLRLVLAVDVLAADRAHPRHGISRHRALAAARRAVGLQVPPIEHTFPGAPREQPAGASDLSRLD